MKTRITVGAAMLLTLGSALAGGLIFQPERSSPANEFAPVATNDDSHSVTPEMIAKWKATAATADYTPPMLPI